MSFSMFGFLKQVGDYTRDAVDAARNLAQGFAVTFDHMQRRPVTVQYPYEKLIPSEQYRGRIHYEFDKCIACEVCVCVFVCVCVCVFVCVCVCVCGVVCVCVCVCLSL